jgi:hypothetical protein
MTCCAHDCNANACITPECYRRHDQVRATVPGTRPGGQQCRAVMGGVADATVGWWHGSSCATARGRGTSDQWDAGPAAGRRSTARPQSEEQSGSRAAAVRGQRPTDGQGQARSTGSDHLCTWACTDSTTLSHEELVTAHTSKTDRGTLKRTNFKVWI